MSHLGDESLAHPAGVVETIDKAVGAEACFNRAIAAVTGTAPIV